MNDLSKLALNIGNNLSVLATAAALDRPTLASGCYARLLELLPDEKNVTDEHLRPFAAIGDIADTVSVGGVLHPSGHHAVFAQFGILRLVLDREGIGPGEIDREWPRAKEILADWLYDEWQDDFRAVLVRVERESAIIKQRSDRQPDDPPAGDDPPTVVHSPDFRSVSWFGVNYSFTPNQAACVKTLWEAWQSGAPDVGGETLLQAAVASTQRIDVVFRDNAAWGTMVVQGGTKGSYCLAKPTADSPKRAKRTAKKKSARTRK